jgi:glycosyltransferase involved in cell wall biosynthesis
MHVSIVIPAKNEEKNLPTLLGSIRAQSLQDLEIIVADAKSTDDTRQIAGSFGAKVVDGGMPGPGRNRGAAHAKGEFLAFFDADVILPHEDFLKDTMTEMQERGLDVATCKVQAHKGKMIDHALHEAYNAYTIATEKVLPHAAGFCMFARRATHEAIGGFDEDVVFAEDHDYARRAKKAGYVFGILRSHKIPVSVRRMEKEGRAKTAAKYAYSELRMIAKGSFKHKIPFTYDFDHSKKKPSSDEASQV